MILPLDNDGRLTVTGHLGNADNAELNQMHQVIKRVLAEGGGEDVNDQHERLEGQLEKLDIAIGVLEIMVTHAVKSEFKKNLCKNHQ